MPEQTPTHYQLPFPGKSTVWYPTKPQKFQDRPYQPIEYKTFGKFSNDLKEQAFFSAVEEAMQDD